MKRHDLMELIGLLLALGGFVALLYGLSVLAEWLAYVFGGGIVFLTGAVLVALANRAANPPKRGDA
jgi:hypothetical protein